MVFRTDAQGIVTFIGLSVLPTQILALSSFTLFVIADTTITEQRLPFHAHARHVCILCSQSLLFLQTHCPGVSTVRLAITSVGLYLQSVIILINPLYCLFSLYFVLIILIQYVHIYFAIYSTLSYLLFLHQKTNSTYQVHLLLLVNCIPEFPEGLGE